MVPQFESSFVFTTDFFDSNCTNFIAMDLNIPYDYNLFFSFHHHSDVEPTNAKQKLNFDG